MENKLLIKGKEDDFYKLILDLRESNRGELRELLSCINYQCVPAKYWKIKHVIGIPHRVMMFISHEFERKHEQLYATSSIWNMYVTDVLAKIDFREMLQIRNIGKGTYLQTERAFAAFGFKIDE